MNRSSSDRSVIGISFFIALIINSILILYLLYYKISSDRLNILTNDPIIVIIPPQPHQAAWATTSTSPTPSLPISALPTSQYSPPSGSQTSKMVPEAETEPKTEPRIESDSLNTPFDATPLTKTHTAQLAFAPVPDQSLKKVSSSSPAPSFTLAQLAGGFLDHVHNNKSSVNIKGDDNAQITQEQLKHERYLHKLSVALQQSFKMHEGKIPVKEAANFEVRFVLHLKKSGAIERLELLQSSGNSLIDSFVLGLVKDAGSSFPPVPEYLPHNPYIIPCRFFLSPYKRHY